MNKRANRRATVPGGGYREHPLVKIIGRSEPDGSLNRKGRRAAAAIQRKERKR